VPDSSRAIDTGKISVRAVYAIDVGKTREPANFAWARVEPENATEVIGSDDIQVLASKLVHDLNRGYSVALGFEAPLFIPVPEDAAYLSRGRAGEGSRAWAAPAGSTVAMLGIHQAAWLLRALYRSCGDICELTIDREMWHEAASRSIIFCWEAFVSQGAHGDCHVQDAATAAIEFVKLECGLVETNIVTAEQPLSLIGAAALWSGWTDDIRILRKPALVIKPTEPYPGPIRIVR